MTLRCRGEMALSVRFVVAAMSALGTKRPDDDWMPSVRYGHTPDLAFAGYLSFIMNIRTGAL